MSPCLAATYLLIPMMPVSAQVVEKWITSYDGPNNRDDLPVAMVLDGRGDVFVTGSSYLNGPPPLQYYYTAKYAAATGTMIWEKRCCGPRNLGFRPAVAVDGSGNLIFSGTSENSGSNDDFYTAKYAAADGATIWEKHYNGPGNSEDSSVAVAVDGAGDVLVTGSSTNADRSMDWYTAKYAATNGGLLWEKRYDAPEGRSQTAAALALDGNGNVIVTGSAFSGSKLAYHTAKYAGADGALLWERRYDGPGTFHDYSRAVAVDGEGNVVVTGSSRGSANNPDFYTAKYAGADGALLWEQRYDGASRTDEGSAVALDASGNVIVTGYSERTLTREDCYTVKYAAGSGEVLWENRYDGNYGHDRGEAVVVDGAGDVFISGSSTGIITGDYDFYTAKYAASTGALLWERRYAGLAKGANFVLGPKSLALTAEGGAIVTGTSHHVSSLDFTTISRDYATIYYVPGSTIMPAWRQQYFGAAANSGNASDTADPDNDGLPNLIEWACGLNPTTISPPPVEPGILGQLLGMRYRRTVVAVDAGAVFTVEWSDSLLPGDWHTVGVSEHIVSGVRTEDVVAYIPAGTGKRFARLRVTAPP